MPDVGRGGTYLARHLSHLGTRTPWHLAGPSVWYLSVSDSGQMAAWREITCADKRALADTYSLAYSCLAQIIHVSQMHCSATVLNASIQMDTARVSCVLPALEGFYTPDQTSCCRLRKIIVIPKTIKLSWEIHFSYSPVSLSTKHTEPPKWRYYRDDVCCYWAEVLAYSMSDPPRYDPEAWKMKRKVHLGHSNFFVWEGRQRSGSKFWIKENDEGRKIRKKAGREIQWSPLPLEKTTSEAVGETKAGTEGQTK